MKVRLRDVPGLEGEWELVEAGYTTKEWREIKRHTGLLPADIEDHAARSDPDVLAVLLWVTLTREGKDPRHVWDALDSMVLSDDTVEVAAGDEPAEEEDAVPPESTPASTDDGNETEPDAEPERSGETSPVTLALLDNPQSSTGVPRSATGAG